MKYDSAFYSEKGGRDVNEDAASVTAKAHSLLAIVADGLGGMGDGKVASEDAVSCLSDRLLEKSMDEDLLCAEMMVENQRILNMHHNGKQMMTTVAVLWAEGDQALAATIGDTRIYQFRGEKIEFQSTDHSVAQLAVFSGAITREQLRNYPGRNRLLRALGAEEQVQVDLQELHLLPGDRLLICSDGFWKLIVEQEMLLWGGEETAEQWLNRMRMMASQRCGSCGDNHSAIAVIITEETEYAG